MPTLDVSGCANIEQLTKRAIAALEEAGLRGEVLVIWERLKNAPGMNAAVQICRDYFKLVEYVGHRP